MKNNDYCTAMARGHDYDRFLQSLFLPDPVRERVHALLALDAELAHVRAHVREEMLGHIRYAWWEESLTAITEGHKPREHPVLVEIAKHQLAAEALQLAQKHRAVYPEQLNEEPDISTLIPLEAQENWNKAATIIAVHRNNYGSRWNSWLIIKLLLKSLT